VFEGVKARNRERRGALLDSARPALVEGETPKVMALGQTLHPWIVFAISIGGSVMIVHGLIGDTLPRSVGILGVVLALAGIGFSAIVPRRLVIRTDGGLYVIRLDRNGKLTEDPRSARTFWTPIATLPVLEGKSFEAGDERIHPLMGGKPELEAIKSALEPAGGS
jgi:hypothetical protein